MKNRIEGTFEILSALLVLFTAMLDPRISIILSISLLAIFGLYKLFKR
jgi:hypothetical protein